MVPRQRNLLYYSSGWQHSPAGYEKLVIRNERLQANVGPAGVQAAASGRNAGTFSYSANYAILLLPVTFICMQLFCCLLSLVLFTTQHSHHTLCPSCMGEQAVHPQEVVARVPRARPGDDAAVDRGHRRY